MSVFNFKLKLSIRTNAQQPGEMPAAVAAL